MDVEVSQVDAEQPDIGNINPSITTERTFPKTTTDRTDNYPVVIKRSALYEVYRHGRTTTDVEVCGVLVGDVYRDEVGAFLYVDAVVRGEHAAHQAAQVTFTSETWSHIQQMMETHHPGKRIVGWYHTHPGFGIFLSEMDLFIHRNFFNLPWQAALVYDPCAEQEGVFIWQQGRTARQPLMVEPDVAEEPTVRLTHHRGGGEDAAHLATRLDDLEARQRRQADLITALLVIALSWPLLAPTAGQWIWQKFEQLMPPADDGAGALEDGLPRF